MKKPLILLGLSLLSMTSLVGCGGGEQTPTCVVLKDTNDLLATPITDSLAFPYEEDYAKKDFFETQSGIAYGKATLSTVTDGDTMSFTTVNGHYIKCRLLGINTPESTANVEAWGVKASAFAKKTFAEATDFCLVNDIDAYGKTDNTSSQRSMSFVWYKTKEGQWKLYNLECVEQCYSKNLLFQDSNLKYLSYFTKAGEAGEACKVRVYGTKDPDFNDDKTVKEVTCYYVRHHYDEIGTDYETGSSGYYLRITGLVVGMIGDHLVIRDLNRDPEQEDTDPLECMYCYAGYNSALSSFVSIGDVVRFYGRTSTFPAGTKNIQFTDLHTSTSSADPRRFENYPAGTDEWKEYVGGAAYGADYDPIDLTTLPVTSSSSLDDYFGHFVSINVKIRVATYDKDEDGTTVEFNSHYRDTKNASTGLRTATTVYAYAATSVNGDKGTPLNIRIDASGVNLHGDNFEVGATYNVRAYLASYYENYQLQVFTDPSYIKKVA